MRIIQSVSSHAGFLVRGAVDVTEVKGSPRILIGPVSTVEEIQGLLNMHTS